MLICTTASGACIPLGGLLARIESVQPGWIETEFRHSVIAFGGGILLAAVSLVLIPESQHYIRSPWLTIGIFLAGGITFMLLERYLYRRGGGAPQTMAMLLDYLPESVALGGMFALGSPSAPLLALLIGLQNLPEGFNASREMTSGKRSRPASPVARMVGLMFLGPLFGTAGWFLSSGFDLAIGVIMVFAAGGILYLIFQDIAPQSKLEKHWAPTLGAVLGFGAGFLGQLLLGNA